MLKPSQEVGAFSIPLPLKRTGAPPAGDEGKESFFCYVFVFGWTPYNWQTAWLQNTFIVLLPPEHDDTEGVLGGTVICPSISSL